MDDNMNTPKRGNLYMLVILVYQLALSFLLPFLEAVIGTRLLETPVSIVPTHFLLFIVPFVFYLLFTSQKVSDVLPLRKVNFTNIGLIVLMCVTIQPMMMVLSGLSTLIFPNNVSAVMSELYTLPLAAAVLVTSLTPAITEEITLRGVVLTNYKNVSARKAALLNGILFGIIHLDLQQFLYAFLLGYMFAYFVYYTKSIFASMIAHFTVNFIQTAMAYLSFSILESSESAADIARQTSNADLMTAVVSLSVVALIFTPVCIVIFRAFAYYNKQRMVVEALEPISPPCTDETPEPAPIPEEDPPNPQSYAINSEPPVNLNDKIPHTQPQANNKILNWPLTLTFFIFIAFTALMILIQNK